MGDLSLSLSFSQNIWNIENNVMYATRQIRLWRRRKLMKTKIHCSILVNKISQTDNIYFVIWCFLIILTQRKYLYFIISLFNLRRRWVQAFIKRFYLFSYFHTSSYSHFKHTELGFQIYFLFRKLRP